MWVEKNGPAWRIRDLINGKKVTLESGYPTKTAAKARMTALRADKMRGEFIDPRDGKLLLGEWIDIWWPTYEAGLKPTAQISEGRRARRHVQQVLGHLALDEVDNLAIQRWIAYLLAGDPAAGRRKLAPKSVRNCHGVLHTILGAAVVARKMRSNPCSETRLPQAPHHEMRFLSEPEIGRLLGAVPEHWRPLVVLLVSTGLRWGEAIALRPQDIDVLGGKLTVVRAMHELSSTGAIVFTEPKTERSRRTVTFPQRPVGEVLAGPVATRARGELVFRSPRGSEVRTRNFRRGWIKWVSVAGLDGLRIHDLRHTHAALLISAGVPLTAIQRRLGHSSIAVTSDLYGHLLPVVDEGIMAAVTAALSAVELELVEAEVADEVGIAA
ncbi:tyrosine-type recombinase/integrase [Catenuloplanes atrovinosus]|uniref:Integrase n=1 Tax=Catenuloplanes atrovinosus TaxID=137266 RepID=A0AAE3YUH5_9ACTN|nr:tyrosine-type recombinase/integrase [Catenuloplanes atrovinosus]MDR7278896.1 integrase [Catenuloplanes atrovinosus]